MECGELLAQDYINEVLNIARSPHSPLSWVDLHFSFVIVINILSCAVELQLATIGPPMKELSTYESLTACNLTGKS